MSPEDSQVISTFHLRLRLGLVAGAIALTSGCASFFDGPDVVLSYQDILETRDGKAKIWSSNNRTESGVHYSQIEAFNTTTMPLCMQVVVIPRPKLAYRERPVAKPVAPNSSVELVYFQYTTTQVQDILPAIWMPNEEGICDPKRKRRVL
jgi:hypothetical protein